MFSQERFPLHDGRQAAAASRCYRTVHSSSRRVADACHAMNNTVFPSSSGKPLSALAVSRATPGQMAFDFPTY
ncbi:MAG: hypothetical protein Q4D62_05885 [Planctomycetia bacterium]|nr:hypothetical protein [Planctomycetia bacterium]